MQGLKFPWHYIRDCRHSDNSYENFIFLEVHGFVKLLSRKTEISSDDKIKSRDFFTFCCFRKNVNKTSWAISVYELNK